MPNDTSAPRMKQLTIRGSRTGTRFELYGVVAVKGDVKVLKLALLVQELKAREFGFEFGVGALRLGHGHSLFRIETSLDEAFGVEVGVELGELEGKGVDDAGLVVVFTQDCGDDFKMLLGHDCS